MMLTFWSSRVQTERGQTNTATSAQLALSEVHSLLPHPCDHPWNCKHKNPQKQQPRNKCPFQAQIGCSQGWRRMLCSLLSSRGSQWDWVFVSLELDKPEPQATQNDISQTGKYLGDPSDQYSSIFVQHVVDKEGERVSPGQHKISSPPWREVSSGSPSLDIPVWPSQGSAWVHL